jgi:hypothetical protein
MTPRAAMSAKPTPWGLITLAAAMVGLAALTYGAPPLAAQQMPDPKEIAGIPLPVGDLPSGTVVVRVIRGSLGNNVADQPVELSGAGPARSVTTDATGRAQFASLTPGTRVTARTTVGSERLESQEITVPSSGGIRVLLVATDPAAVQRAEADRKLAAGPAQAGMVVLGEESRFVFEFGDASLTVFNILQIVNTARTPVQPAQPVVFDLPAGATGATVLQNSSPQATAAGRRVTVAGPFAPGTTLVQFAYSMPYSGGNLTVEQSLPVPLGRVLVVAQKMGAMQLSSPQVSQQRDMPADGQTYIVGQGPGLKAGDPVAFHFSNLPHAPLWPRYLALAIAVAILAIGGWASLRGGSSGEADKNRARLETRRGQLFAELTAIEEQHREGRIDPQRYAARRGELIAALERVYAEIDREAA